MEISEKLTRLKKVSITMTNLSYFNVLAPQVFTDQSVFVNIPVDIQFVNQIGGQLYGYFSNPDSPSQAIWLEAFKQGLDRSVADISALIQLIPSDASKGQDLKAVLNALLTDCQALYSLITLK